MPKRKVKQGECLFSIAADANLPWEKLWNHAENADLKSKRKLPNVLYPGDELFVPESEKMTESSPSENKHKFKVKRPKTCIRLNLLYDGKPMENKAYKLEVDGKLHEGETDDKGVLEQAVDATAKDGLLEIIGDKSVHKLQLGYLDPVGNTSGLQARLNNLGFDAGKVDDDWGKLTRTGMQGFQSNKKLKTTKTPNDDTRDRLEQEHGV
jgi:hypothetical protein